MLSVFWKVHTDTGSKAAACSLPATYISSSPSWLLSADGYTLNDGSCACHKQWGWFTNACEGSFCFDYIGECSAGRHVVMWQSKPLSDRDTNRRAAKSMRKRLAASSACCRVPQSAGGAGLHGSPNCNNMCLQPQSPRGQQIGRALLQPTFASCRCQRLLLLQNPTVSRTRGLVGGDWQFPDMVVTAECLLLQGPRGQQTGRALQQPSTQPAPPTQTSVAFAIPLSVQTDRHGAPPVQSFRSRAAGRRTGPSLSWLLTGD